MSLVHKGNQTPVILASTSIYRKELLERLAIKFTVAKPIFDEDKAKKEHLDWPGDKLIQFLASEKARSLSTHDNCVIGADQAVLFQNQIIGKPKTKENAIKILKAFQGHTHILATAMTVIFKGREENYLNITEMKMRSLSDLEILHYIDLDQPFDCAGSYKIEKHGITLFDSIKTEDFTAIQGLPLLELTKILIKFGYTFPDPELLEKKD